MSCDVGEAREGLETELWRRWSDWKLGEWAFGQITYVTAHSPTLLSPLLRHRIFTYVTWRAVHDLSIIIFYLKFNFYAWVYILKFCHLKIVSGAVDTRKWSTKWRNWNISGISLVRAQSFFSFPYVSIKTPFLVTGNDTGYEWSMFFTSQSITSKQRYTCGHLLILVDPGGPVVIILASGSEVRVFDPGRGRWIFSEGKIMSMTSFGREVKPWVPCRRFTVRKITPSWN